MMSAGRWAARQRPMPCRLPMQSGRGLPCLITSTYGLYPLVPRGRATTSGSWTFTHSKVSINPPSPPPHPTPLSSSLIVASGLLLQAARVDEDVRMGYGLLPGLPLAETSESSCTCSVAMPFRVQVQPLTKTYRLSHHLQLISTRILIANLSEKPPTSDVCSTEVH